MGVLAHELCKGFIPTALHALKLTSAPPVHGGAANEGHVHAKTAVSARALRAEIGAVRYARPVRVLGLAVHAEAVGGGAIAEERLLRDDRGAPRRRRRAAAAPLLGRVVLGRRGGRASRRLRRQSLLRSEAEAEAPRPEPAQRVGPREQPLSRAPGIESRGGGLRPELVGAIRHLQALHGGVQPEALRPHVLRQRALQLPAPPPEGFRQRLAAGAGVLPRHIQGLVRALLVSHCTHLLLVTCSLLSHDARNLALEQPLGALQLILQVLLLVAARGRLACELLEADIDLFQTSQQLFPLVLQLPRAPGKLGLCHLTARNLPLQLAANMVQGVGDFLVLLRQRLGARVERGQRLIHVLQQALQLGNAGQAP
mmetsp:Transcript_2737/g.10752  ORF Transcript_2737/g.10752 Transcript_2737/m.10752 type:complete len:369 (+) Transcript_2737:391-1497(+)